MDLTIIVPYYNEFILLDKLLREYQVTKKNFPNLKLIVIDDGSMKEPAIDVCDGLDLEDFSLYRVKEDLGFNAHGCRNLGMTVSDTEWNFMVDIDYHIMRFDYDYFFSFNYENKKNVYAIADNTRFVNSFIIHKDTFFEFGGYDEEFVNFHYGDRPLFEYMRKHYNVFLIVDDAHIPVRGGRKIFMDENIPITLYPDDKTLIQPSFRNHLVEGLVDMVKRRYAANDFSNKKILNFDWERII